LNNLAKRFQRRRFTGNSCFWLVDF
jgi:hypothetical protein